MVTPTATREELICALAELARRTEQYRWLLIRVCPWPFAFVYPGEDMDQNLDLRIQHELDKQPERRPPFVFSPEQGELEF